VHEDPALELLQRRAGVKSELVRESTLCSPVNIEGTRLLPGSVEREHQLPEQPFTEWVLCDQTLELGDEIACAAAGEVGIDALLDRGETILLERHGHPVGGGLIDEIRERTSSPQRER